MNTTYYQTLGVVRTATQAEIKAAFKALAIKYHPDKHGGATTYEARFKQINEAYQVLSDPRKKQSYDLKLYYSTPRPNNFGPTSPYQAASAYRHGTPNSTQQGRPASGTYQQTYTSPPPRPAANPKPKPKPQERTWRDYGIAVMVMICLFGFGTVVKFTMDHITAVDNYETALSYIKDKRYGEAHGLLREAVTFKPTYGDAYLKLAELQLVVFHAPEAAQINYTAAFENLEKVTPQSYYMRAKSYMETGDFARADKDLSKALSLDSTLFMASFDRGVIRLHNLGKVEASVADFSQFIRFGKDAALRAQAFQFRGYANHLTGNFSESKTDFQESLQLDPNNSVTYSLFAELMLSLRDISTACSYFAKAYNLGDRSMESNLLKYCSR